MKKILILLLLVTTTSFAKTNKHSKHEKYHKVYGIPVKESSVLHFDVTEDKILFNKNITNVRPLASITKLMTAMVALDYDQNLNRELMLNPSSVSTSLPRKKYTRNDLFHAMLIRSDNGAAETIASDYPGGRNKFIEAMNKKAKKFEMTNTNFKDPTGLSISNISTANDISSMIIASSHYPLIRDVSNKKQAYFETLHKKKIRTIVLNNTNRPLLFEFDDILISKTGFTNPAGWCVALFVEKKEKERIHRHVIVVLGAKNKQDRIDTVKEIMYNEILDKNLQDPNNGHKTSDG